MTIRTVSIFIFIGLLSYFFVPQEYVAKRWIASNKVSINELKEQLTERMSRVPEFVEIQNLAKKYGIKEVYLFGGTASAWAHYVQWDMEREKGINNLQAERFDYDYTSIFRSNQDMDIVIDGPADIAAAIENEMKEKFPFFQGKQSVWEVRLLNSARGDKDAILNNPDFLGQHSDSHSTGLIEVFGDGNKTIIDVKEVDATTPKFLMDVHSKRLHYYYLPELHKTTKRFVEGNNPEIFSVVRYLTKAFQYELEIPPESLTNIKKVIDQFNPRTLDHSREYISYWLEKNGPKLFQNSVNIEYAWNTLEDLGLRQKLIDINQNESEIESLAWWMSKEPLRSKKVGTGVRKTAAELGLDILAHETDTFAAYESITKAHSGAPNVLISRRGKTGEGASLGNGFYTKAGTTGGTGSGITVRFHINPQAREGTDFIIYNDYVVVKNKNALTIIPESIQISPIEYFKKISKGELFFESSDRAIQEKVRRKVFNSISYASDDTFEKIYQIVKNSNSENWQLYLDWLTLKKSNQFPEIIESLIDQGRFNNEIVEHILSNPLWKDHPEWVERLIKSGTVDKAVVTHILSKPHWKNHPDWIEQLITKGNVDLDIVKHVLSKTHWQNHPEWIEKLLRRGNLDRDMIKHVLSKTQWQNHPEWIEQLLRKNDKKIDRAICQYILSQPYYKDRTDWVEILLKRKDPDVDRAIIQFVLSSPHWKDHPEWVEQFLKNGTYDFPIVSNILSKPHWANHPEWVEFLLKKGTVDHSLVGYVLPHPHWKDHPEWILRLLEKGDSGVGYEIGERLLKIPHIKNHPKLLAILKGKPVTYKNLVRYARFRNMKFGTRCFSELKLFLSRKY